MIFASARFLEDFLRAYCCQGTEPSQPGPLTIPSRLEEVTSQTTARKFGHLQQLTTQIRPAARDVTSA